jgi:hypothetical protein
MFRKTISKRIAFVGMITFILGSALLTFTVFRKPKPEHFPKMPGLSLSSGDGLAQTVSIYQDLEHLEILGGQVRAILKRRKLSDADSAVLKRKLKQIDSIYKRAVAH